MTRKSFKYSTGHQLSYVYDKKENRPVILYLHGLLSSSKSQKGIILQEFALENNFSFLSVDYSSHGLSDGKPEDFRVHRCLEDVLNVISYEKITEPLIVVGSSLGGWIGLLLSEKLSSQVSGVVTIACAADFTKFIWNNVLDDNVKALLQSGVILGPNNETKGYCFSYPMFLEAEKCLVLDRKINYAGPVLLLHGDMDETIPFQNSLLVKDRLISKDVTCSIIKGEHHRLSGYDLSGSLSYFIKSKGLDYVK